MANKKYLELFDAQMDFVRNSNVRPNLLLQACCAPCSSSVLLLLMETFKVTLFFNGHNIYPYEEYLKREKEIKRIVEFVNRDYNGDIELVIIEPDIEQMQQRLSFGADQKEGGTRCQACYAIRFKETCDYAVQNNFQYVSTVMTISRQKCSEKINTVAEKVVLSYPSLIYLYSDFKKRKGIDKANELCKAYDIYKQNYCGCKYSLRDRISWEQSHE